MSVSDEKKMGEEIARSVIDEYGIIDIRGEEKRLQHIGAALVKACERTEVDFHFYIINTDQVNAFALPGGYIFVTRGMMDFVDDDDELAAVIGHEIVHVALKHGVVLYKKSMKSMMVNLLILLLTQEPNLVLANEMYQQGQNELFGRKAELDSDRVGLDYMVKSGYDPAAMSRLMEKLHRIEQHRAPIFDGYFEVHPPTDERVGIIDAHLKRLRLDTSRTSSYTVRARTYVKEVCPDGGACAAALMSGSREILKFAVSDGELSSYDRARAAAATVNRLLDSGVQIYDITARTADETPSLFAKDKLVATALPGDAEAAGKTPAATAAAWAENLKNFIWASLVNDDF